MSIEVNDGVVGDTAKLIMYPLIVRQIRRDPTLVEKAITAHARHADPFEGWPFVHEWDDLSSLPSTELISKLISRERGMGAAPQFAAILQRVSTSEIATPAFASGVWRSE